jgi:hypothetical protein
MGEIGPAIPGRPQPCTTRKARPCQRGLTACSSPGFSDLGRACIQQPQPDIFPAWSHAPRLQLASPRSLDPPPLRASLTTVVSSAILRPSYYLQLYP